MKSARTLSERIVSLREARDALYSAIATANRAGSITKHLPTIESGGAYSVTKGGKVAVPEPSVMQQLGRVTYGPYNAQFPHYSFMIRGR